MIDVSFTLDELYNTEARVTLPNDKVVTVRTLTDAEVNMRDLASLEASSRKEEELSDKTGEQYLSMIEPLERLDPPDLIAIIMAVRERLVDERVRSEYPFRYIPFPDEATEDERREVLTKRREHEERVRQRRSEEKSRRLTEEREELESLSEEELLGRATNNLVRTEMFTAQMAEFYAQTLHLACRDDGDKPVFDLGVIRRHGRKDGLNEMVFSRLLEVYGEIDTTDPWELEKHP